MTMKVEAREIKILVEAEAMAQLKLWVQLAKGEISFLGLVDQVEDGFIITRIFLPFQSCNGAATNIEADAVAKLMIELEAKGIDTSNLKAWIHSHADMQVFWSGTDTSTIEKFKPEDYFVSLVINKKNEIKARVDFYRPFRLCFQDVSVEIKLPDFGVGESCKTLFDERVKEAGFFGIKENDLVISTPGFGGRKGERSEFTMGMTEEEIINKVSTGEMTWQEAEELMTNAQGEERWLYDF
jgi:hypothetical protein